MAEQFKKIDINGQSFQLYLIDPFEAVGLDIEVAQLCAPVVEALAAAGKGAGKEDAKDKAFGAETSGEPGQEGQEPAADEEMSDEEIERMMGAASKLLRGLKPSEFQSLLKRLLDTVEWLDPRSGRAVQIGTSTPDQRRQIFGQNLLQMYRLMLEVARFNRFLPFALGDIGSLVEKMNGSLAAAKRAKSPAPKLALSGGPQ